MYNFKKNLQPNGICNCYIEKVDLCFTILSTQVIINKKNKFYEKNCVNFCTRFLNHLWK
jgi:hypothetical protein